MPDFAELPALNVWLEQRCMDLWREIPHGFAGSIVDVSADEQKALMALPPAFDGFVELSMRVSPRCLISFERNRYSVPTSFANRPVSLTVYLIGFIVLFPRQSAFAVIRGGGADRRDRHNEPHGWDTIVPRGRREFAVAQTSDTRRPGTAVIDVRAGPLARGHRSGLCTESWPGTPGKDRLWGMKSRRKQSFHGPPSCVRPALFKGRLLMPTARNCGPQLGEAGGALVSEISMILTPRLVEEQLAGNFSLRPCGTPES